MSTLQISLAVLGVVLLVVIVAYNSWTARRNAPRRAEHMDETMSGEPGLGVVGHGPDLTHGLREPVFGDFGAVAPGAAAAQMPAESAGRFAEADAQLARLAAQDASEQQRQAEQPEVQAPPPAPAPEAPMPSQPQDAASRVEPTLAEAPRMPAATEPERRGQLDALIDAIAPVQVAQAVPGEVAMQALPSTRRAGNKPFAIEGLNQQTRQWEALRSGQRYIGFHAGVQLANRTGALNEIEFSEFVAKAQRFADALGAAPDMPDMLHEVGRARELDQFAGEHDAQLSFMLRARRASWSIGYVQQNASRQGFVPSSMPGRMNLPSPTVGMPPVLVLHYDPQAAVADDLDQSVVREILLSLDVAQVPRGEQPFAQLRHIAEQLCQTMDGVLCDQNGYLLPVSALDPIQSDLEMLYDKLDSRELSAGSLLARRLFS